jgi:acetyl-CoA synthetase
VLDLHAGDVLWCTADPGWVTGTSYGIISPLVCGACVIVDEAEIDPARWYDVLADEAVDVWYTAPTAVRMSMRAGEGLAELRRPRPHLRLAASVGEALPAEAVRWGERVLGLPFRDNWWQTETGGIMIANFGDHEIRPGSMGVPIPGIDAGVLRCDADGTLVRTDNDDVVVVTGEAHGMLALRVGWPSMFRGYLDAPERYAACLADGGGSRWYLTGDLARRDAEGYFWFVCRADDVIKTAGHLIGPHEVETVLTEHPDVADAGVYGVPDPVAGAVVHAVVALRPGVVANDAVLRSILALARSRLGAAVAPRRIIAADLPKTRSGKVMRRLLRARELGLPDGDTSTLE